MGSTIVEVAVKAAAGGALVLTFAALAQMLSPKRLAGVLSAAPSVALAGLTVTLMFSGVTDATASLRGMAVGAAGFVVYCLLAVPLCRAMGTWQGSATALAAWAAVAAVGYALVLG